MKTILERWSISYKELRNEAESLFYLDLCNKTRYSRRKNQEGLLELASREAHEKRMIYYATILEDDDTPYCAIRADEGYFGIDFLGEDLENYLIYVYRERHTYRKDVIIENKLFLEGMFLLPKGKEYFDGVISMELSFSPDGNWRSYAHKGEPGAWESIVTDHATLSKGEVELFWVDYPEFGKYEQLIRLDRIPQQVCDWILRYTEQTHPRFREHLERDRNMYRSKK